MRRILCFFLCLVLLSSLVYAAESQEKKDLSSRLQDFIVGHDLNGSNFALSYINSDTGESYNFNQDALFPAGNLWMLPLHMYYYEQESLGAYTPPPENPTYVFTVDGKTLTECRYRSIILGDSSVAEKMRDLVGSYDQFKMTVNEAFGHVPEESLSDAFFAENKFSTRFWINSLRAIADQPELFQDMMRNYSMIQTVDGFASFDKVYSLVHIRSQENGFICDVGEVSGPQTYLLACCVSEAAGGDEILAAVNDLICTYVEEIANVGGNQGSNAFIRGDSAMEIVSGGNKDKSTALIWIGIALGGAVVLAAVLSLVFFLLRRRRDDYFY